MRRLIHKMAVTILIFILLGSIHNLNANDPSQVELYAVHEIAFEGPQYGPQDAPTVDVEFITEWRHESGWPRYEIHGFWDGDGAGGTTGKVFKVRFCPTQVGKWTLVKTRSNKSELNGQKEGYTIICQPSTHPGFWLVDENSAGQRWYRRSDGSHPYVIGNTMYSFLSEYRHDGPNQSDVTSDVKGNAGYFKKIRFAITGDRYPHPTVKPFLNNQGKPTDNGNFSHRPNPAWFRQRVDVAVQTAFEQDLIADLILNGPDTRDSRSVLVAKENGGDCTPILKYIAARYGSLPNVWICLANEWDIKRPKFTAREIATIGLQIKTFLAYPIPLSVHAAPTDWKIQLNTLIPWNDHVILQHKIKSLPTSADFIEKNYWIGGANKPVINDELAYEGRGDHWTEPDVIEAHLGAFLGGGYGTTGFKHPVSKQGHYFTGAFNPAEHTSADNLAWLREKIEANITFWKMQPVVDLHYTGNTLSISIFRHIDADFRAMEWKNHEYVLGTNKTHTGIEARLPAGKWQIKCFDVISKTEKLLSPEASGDFTFDAPDSRATFFLFKFVN